MIQRIGLQALRGFFMGAADIVPGVSGGTVALILGIYRDLISNVQTGAHFLKSVVTGNMSGAASDFKSIDWMFLIPLGTGVIAAFLILRHWMESLLVSHGEGLAAVFCGLVLASCILVWSTITERDATRLGVLAAVAVVTFAVLGLQAGPAINPSLLVFFGVGAIAICAMILPGISGSFILLILGMYWAVLVDGTTSQLIVFALGAVVGLAVFSTPLNWVLEHHEQTVMAVLLGLMIGSSRLLWPWPHGVGDFGESAAEFVNGTDLELPTLSQGIGGLALALAAAVATLVIVRMAEAPSKP